MEKSTEKYFEPLCSWKRGREFDTIEIDLDGLTVKGVKLTVKCIGKKNSMISIAAESPRCLQKEIEVSNDDYDVGKLHARFCSTGTLFLELPKKAASNKLEISKPKLEIRKFLQESVRELQRKFISGVEYFSKPSVAASGFTLLAIALFVCKYILCKAKEAWGWGEFISIN